MMTVKEYAEKEDVSLRTVYRWIEEGKVKAEKKFNKWLIIEDDNKESPNNDKNLTSDRLEKENEYLRKELSRLHDTIEKIHQTLEDERQRHDTIVLSLSNQLSEERKKLEDKTNQLSEKQKKLEDIRGRKLWTRVKTALGFAS